MPPRQAPNPYATDDTGSTDTPQGSKQATNQPRNPIDVPYYVTDPSTGLPLEQNGQKVRWQAQVPVTPYGPGSRGMEGPGTAPSSGVAFELPRYFDGDERNPASFPVDDMILLQKYMRQIGLVKPGDGQLGVWDATWADAYKKVLGFANSSGIDDKTALARWGDMAAQNPPDGAPLQRKLSNPDDLRKVVRETVVSTLGQGWDSTRIDGVVSQIQAAEAAYYDAQATSDTVTAPPSADVLAEKVAREQDPQGAQAHDALGYQKEFFAALKGVV